MPAARWRATLGRTRALAAGSATADGAFQPRLHRPAQRVRQHDALRAQQVLHAQLGLARGGVVITNLYVGSPAQDAGLRPGDLVIAVAGTEVASAQEVLARVAQAKPGSKIELRVQRGTEIASLSILVTERPRTRA